MKYVKIYDYILLKNSIQYFDNICIYRLNLATSMNKKKQISKVIHKKPQDPIKQMKKKPISS